MENFNEPIDLKLDTVPLIIYTCFVLHNDCQTKSSWTLDGDEVKAQMERHKLEEANMAEQPDPVYSSNTREGEYIRRRITEYINRNLDTS